MIALAYLAALLGATGCMALLDRRFALVLWHDVRRALIVLVVGVAFFLLWDVAAIAAGFYHRGESEAMTGIMLAPELPLEELVFVTFLCYLTLVLHALLARVLVRPRAPREEAR
ncbi:lycopene cyclase domain-containing protein [Georgenia sunbinii]|uniref:lycopene cyclase domain-containing protein n=1 Tax=Georgenia sunbinii TaxID=3117728 RepID=UPI002F26D89A